MNVVNHDITFKVGMPSERQVTAMPTHSLMSLLQHKIMLLSS